MLTKSSEDKIQFEFKLENKEIIEINQEINKYSIKPEEFDGTFGFTFNTLNITGSTIISFENNLKIKIPDLKV